MKKLFILSVSAFLSFGADLPAKAQTSHNPFTGAPTRYSVEVVTASKTGANLTMRMFVDGNKGEPSKKPTTDHWCLFFAAT